MVVFFIIQHDSVSILLGADWLEASRAKFNQFGKNIEIENEVVYANSVIAGQKSINYLQTDDEDGRPIDAIYEGEEEEMERKNKLIEELLDK